MKNTPQLTFMNNASEVDFQSCDAGEKKKKRNTNNYPTVCVELRDAWKCIIHSTVCLREAHKSYRRKKKKKKKRGGVEGWDEGFLGCGSTTHTDGREMRDASLTLQQDFVRYHRMCYMIFLYSGAGTSYFLKGCPTSLLLGPV